MSEKPTFWHKKRQKKSWLLLRFYLSTGGLGQVLGKGVYNIYGYA